MCFLPGVAESSPQTFSKQKKKKKEKKYKQQVVNFKISTPKQNKRKCGCRSQYLYTHPH